MEDRRPVKYLYELLRERAEEFRDALNALLNLRSLEGWEYVDHQFYHDGERDCASVVFRKR